MLDSTNSRYVPDYDYTDPVINEFKNRNAPEHLGKFVMFKGLDSNSYGVDSHEDLISYLIAYAEYLNDEYQVEHYFENYPKPSRTLRMRFGYASGAVYNFNSTPAWTVTNCSS